MAVRLQRFLGRIDGLDPGQFMTDPLVHTPGMMISTIICCPGCSFITPLSEHYEVEKGGLVTPAFTCPSETCSFFDWLELSGWGDVP